MKSIARLGSVVIAAITWSGCVAEEPDGEAPALAVESALDCAENGAPCAVSGMSSPTEEIGIRDLPPRYPFWALQLNLCNSGVAGCYQGGRSVGEAATVIQNNRPDVVTLNEICQNDVVALHATLSAAYPSGTVVWAFQAAGNRGTGGAYKCRNGQDYGVGILAHIPSGYAGYQTFSGLYPMQDGSSNEQRAWLCVAATGHYFACTTHLTNNSGTIALNQCNHLTRTVIPQMHAAAGGAKLTVMGADLNLRYGGSPNAQSCVPPGYYRKGDGSVQHFIASGDLTFGSTRKISMRYTDHPGWFMAMTAP